MKIFMLLYTIGAVVFLGYLFRWATRKDGILRAIPPEIQKKPIVSPEKNWELLIKVYVWNVFTDGMFIRFTPRWSHYKYYKTEHSVKDAIVAQRKSVYHKKVVSDYPKNITNPYKIIKSVRITRFKYIKRDHVA